MPTKSESARANGAKSAGPRTPQGKAASARNSLTHGLRAKAVVLPSESRQEFRSLLDAYLAHFAPSTPVERDLVETMAAARWRLRRIQTIETHLFSLEVLRCSEDVDNEFTNPKPGHYLAFAFQKMGDYGRVLQLLPRYEASLNRTYQGALRQLQTLQSAGGRAFPHSGPTPHSAPAPPAAPPPPPELPNEPEPPCIPPPDTVGSTEVDSCPQLPHDPCHRPNGHNPKHTGIAQARPCGDTADALAAASGFAPPPARPAHRRRPRVSPARSKGWSLVPQLLYWSRN
jgi:hypothetical protein